MRLNYRERFALAYFHEPNFNSVVRPLRDPFNNEYIHYGTHFTNMFLRCYPERITTKNIVKDGGLDVLENLRNMALRKTSVMQMQKYVIDDKTEGDLGA